jgi:hypothetical protein
MPPPNHTTTINIRDVWADSLEKEMALIRDIVDAYPFIAMVRSIHIFTPAALKALVRLETALPWWRRK